MNLHLKSAFCVISDGEAPGALPLKAKHQRDACYLSKFLKLFFERLQGSNKKQKKNAEK